MTYNNIVKIQKEVCDRYGSPYIESQPLLMVGISLNVRSGLLPINGLRHPLEGKTSGWYIWAGDKLLDDPNFFVPIHFKHLIDWCPNVLPYICLAPGWRFLIAGEYVDVWEDKSLINI
ncbi:MAG: hypothetical protein WCO98_00655 [bacterium]